MKRAIISIVGIFITFMMVSAATAVPYTTLEPLSLKINEMEEKMSETKNNQLIEKFEQFLQKYSNGENKELAIEIVQRFFEKKNIDIGTTEYIFQFLIMLVDIILLIFGHNIIGRTIALLVTSILAIPASFVWGVGLMFGFAATLAILLLFLWVLAREEIENILREIFDLSDFWYYYGFITGSIILSIGFLVILLLIPVIYLYCVGQSYILAIEEILDYLSSKINLLEEDYGNNHMLIELINDLKI